MEVSALTLRVLLLFFPGVLCAMLVDALTVHRQRDSAQLLTHAFVLGLTSYLLLYLGQWGCAGAADVLGLPPPRPVTFVDALLNDKIRISWGEIVLAAWVAFLQGLVISACVNNQLLHRLARRLRITRKRGSLDLWSYVLGSPRANWLLVRDLQYAFTYFGWLEEFSETAEAAELWLRDVEVFDSNTAAKLYGADGLYLSRDPRTLVIEIIPAHETTGAADERKDGRADEGKHPRPDGTQSQSADAAAGLRSRTAQAAGPDKARRKRKQRA
jgi:hypothetical protein